MFSISFVGSAIFPPSGTTMKIAALAVSVQSALHLRRHCINLVNSTVKPFLLVANARFSFFRQ